MRIVRAVILLVLVALGVSNATRAAPPDRAHLQADRTLTLEQYWALVDESRDTVAGLKSVPADQARPRLEGLASRWADVGHVSLRDGTTLEVDSGFWAARLRAGNPNLDQLRYLFDTIFAVRDRIPSQSFAEGDVQALREILARPEYQWAEPHPSWIQSQIIRLLDWVSRHLPAGLGINLPSLSGMIAAVILVTVLGYIAIALYRDLARESALPAGKEITDEVLTAQSAMERAEELSALGNFRAAVRYLYLSALLVLDERGLLRYDHTKTNREYLRLVSNDHSLSSPLREVIDVFDRVWYGFQPLDEESYHRYVALVKELETRG